MPGKPGEPRPILAKFLEFRRDPSQGQPLIAVGVSSESGVLGTSPPMAGTWLASKLNGLINDEPRTRR